ncbi:HutD/Ves family protein [Leisingera caerulea]|uniref:HutD family protein n=1 Tax=Leisingera caerulea TaxID=506591 RepID=A0A9Q9HF28_LEICA|nr:HutD family protein [Leisingera caerulea]UWQ53939.1 HutD family protein [Leisingera caerulea]
MRISALTAQAVPWKNGGGVTRELAVHKEGGRMVWRLSLAEIAQSGPFSAFPGLARIHCVVEGAGHTLSNDSTQLEARPLEPLCFDGGTNLDCRLRDGPCRAFNVIYDPTQVTAEPKVLAEGPVPDAEGRQVLFVVSGSVEMAGTDRLGPGEGVVTESAASAVITGGGAVIQVRFLPV